MILDTIFKDLIEFSFPVAISIFLLVRMESKISELSHSIMKLNTVLEKTLKIEI